MNDEQLNRIYAAITILDAKVDEGFARLEETKSDKSDIDRVFKTLDYIVEKLDTDITERAAQNAQLNRHDEAIDEHNGRLARLEQVSA